MPLASMLDFETLGTRLFPVVTHLAVKMFDPEMPPDVQQLIDMPSAHWYVSIESCLHIGMVINDSTVDWWLKKPQIDIIRPALLPANNEPVLDVAEMYLQFYEYLCFYGDPKKIELHCRGIDFDLATLRYIQQRTNSTRELGYDTGRCVRTLCKTVFGNHKPRFEECVQLAAHDPMNDCIVQAYQTQSANWVKNTGTHAGSYLSEHAVHTN